MLDFGLGGFWGGDAVNEVVYFLTFFPDFGVDMDVVLDDPRISGGWFFSPRKLHDRRQGRVSDESVL